MWSQSQLLGVVLFFFLSQHLGDSHIINLAVPGLGSTPLRYMYNGQSGCVKAKVNYNEQTLEKTGHWPWVPPLHKPSGMDSFVWSSSDSASWTRDIVTFPPVYLAYSSGSLKEHFILGTLKPLLDNTGICHFNIGCCYFFIQFKLFLGLGLMTNFWFKPGHFCIMLWELGLHWSCWCLYHLTWNRGVFAYDCLYYVGLL